MSLEPRTAFKAGFLFKCAEAGLTVAETDALLAKVAGIGEFGKWLGTAALPTVWAHSKDLIQNVGMGGLAASAAGGAGVGLMAAELRRGTVDPEEVKKQELIAAYNTFGDQLRQHRQLRKPESNTVRVRL